VSTTSTYVSPTPLTPAPRKTGWKDVGAGVAFTLALRYVVPRLLRRL
jgi:hypothetical protein